MSIQTLDKLQKWVVIVGTVITVILIGLFTTGQSYGNLESAVEENTNHRLDKDIHMPFQEKIKIFVTREEHNDVKKQLDRIENKIDNLR